MKYVVLIAKPGNGYAANLPDLPGCIAAGDTFEETSQLIREAANFHLEGMVEDGETVFELIYTPIEVDVQMQVRC